MLKKIGLLLLVVMMLGLTAACGTETQQVEEETTEVEKVTELYGNYMPEGDEILSYVQDFSDIGMRQSGTEGGVKAQEYIKSKYEEYGLEDIHVIETETPVWTCDDWSLQVGGQEMDSYRMYMCLCDGQYEKGGSLKTNEDGEVSKGNFTCGTFSTSDEGQVEDGDIIYVKSRKALKKMDKADIKGKVVACNIKSPVWSAPYEYYIAQEKGAVAFVGVLGAYFDSNRYNPEDMTYVNGSFNIPGYYVTKKVGDQIKAAVDEAGGSVDAHFEMTVNLEVSDDAGSVVGILPGSDDGDGKMIMVSSHYDSMTEHGASQDGSGCAEVLAMARFFSQIPQEDRERGLLFVLNDTHSSDYDSHDNVSLEYLGGEWIEEEEVILPGANDTDVLADVTIEHVSEEGIIEDNELVMTGNVMPRYACVSNIPALVDIVTDETANLQDEENTGLTEVTPLDMGDELVTDADLFRCEGYGIPVISLISAQPYMYDDCDTMDKVPERALKPVAESMANMIWRLMSLDEASFQTEEE